MKFSVKIRQHFNLAMLKLFQFSVAHTLFPCSESKTNGEIFLLTQHHIKDWRHMSLEKKSMVGSKIDEPRSSHFWTRNLVKL